MSDLTMLTPGLDPDPPVLLDRTTLTYDAIIMGELRRRGWPGSAKGRKAGDGEEGPKQVKAATLAAKVSAGSPLTSDQVELLAKRIAWFLRNPHRWTARDGYAALAAKRVTKDQARQQRKVRETSSATSTEVAAGQQSSASDSRENTSIARAQPVNTSEREDNRPHDQTSANTVYADDQSERSPSPDFDNAKARCEDALRGLGQPSAAPEGPTEQGPQSVSVGATPDLPKVRSFVREIPASKAKSFLFAIVKGQPRSEVLQLGHSMLADIDKLSRVMSGRPSWRKDIIDACAALGLELPC